MSVTSGRYFQTFGLGGNFRGCSKRQCSTRTDQRRLGNSCQTERLSSSRSESRRWAGVCHKYIVQSFRNLSANMTPRNQPPKNEREKLLDEMAVLNDQVYQLRIHQKLSSNLYYQQEEQIQKLLEKIARLQEKLKGK